MTALSDGQKEQVRKLFLENLDKPVTIILFTQREASLPVPGGTHVCETCAQTEEILRNISELNSKLDLRIYDLVSEQVMARQYGIEEIPGIVLLGEKDYGIRYHGVPSGYEFAAVLQAIISVSRRRGELSDRTKRALARISHPVHAKIFVTPT
jgi:alkyl hydroperoxide reductase subunit AhpF